MKFSIMLIVEAETKEEAINRRCAGEVHAIGIMNGEPLKIAPEEWPALLKPIKLLAQTGDRGAGDIIARVIGPIGGDAFKVWYKRLFGKSCNCGHRQEVLNLRWPLK